MILYPFSDLERKAFNVKRNYILICVFDKIIPQPELTASYQEIKFNNQPESDREVSSRLQDLASMACLPVNK